MHNKKIKIPDQNLELEIRKLINHPTGEINEELLLPIKECKFDSVKIKDLDGLQYAQNLRSLKFKNYHIEDLSKIAELPNLVTFDIEKVNIKNFSQISVFNT